MLFHHRLSTSTIDIRNACHPFSTKDTFEGQYVGVHNGMISNDKKLKEEHEKLGINYVSLQPNGTYNDSEALIYDLARYFEGEVDTLTAAGSIAFIVVKKDVSGKPMTLFFGHNDGNPLKMKRTDHSLTISSEGEGESIPVNRLHIFDYETETLRTVHMTIPRSAWTYNDYSSTYKAPYKAPSTTKVIVPMNTGTSNYDFDSRYGVNRGSKNDGQAYLDEILASKDIGSNISDYRDLFGNEDFSIRLGDRSTVLQSFVTDSSGRLASAAIQCQLEEQQARVEMALMSDEIIKEEDEDKQEAIIDYWSNLDDYITMLEGIGNELYDGAKKLEKAQEERAKQPFGFQFSRPIQKGGLLPASTK